MNYITSKQLSDAFDLCETERERKAVRRKSRVFDLARGAGRKSRVSVEKYAEAKKLYNRIRRLHNLEERECEASNEDDAKSQRLAKALEKRIDAEIAAVKKALKPYGFTLKWYGIYATVESPDQRVRVYFE